jgi:hypothetical protein
LSHEGAGHRIDALFLPASRVLCGTRAHARTRARGNASLRASRQASRHRPRTASTAAPLGAGGCVKNGSPLRGLLDASRIPIAGTSIQRCTIKSGLAGGFVSLHTYGVAECAAAFVAAFAILRPSVFLRSNSKSHCLTSKEHRCELFKPRWPSRRRDRAVWGARGQALGCASLRLGSGEIAYNVFRPPALVRALAAETKNTAPCEVHAPTRVESTRFSKGLYGVSGCGTPTNVFIAVHRRPD